MAGYEKSIEYLRAMKEPGNTVFGVSHDHIPKHFPIEQKEDESKLSFGLKGLVLGGVTGGLAGKAAKATNVGSLYEFKHVVPTAIGIGATAGLARNLVEYGKRNNEREKTKRSTTKKKKQS